MIHHRPWELDPHLVRGDLSIKSVTFDGGLMLGLNVPIRGVHDVCTRSWSPNAFVRIDTDSVVSLILPCAEGKQGSYALIRSLVAEELDVSTDQVRFGHAPLDERPYFGPLLAVKPIGSSDAISSNWKPLCEAAATARAMLIAVAGKRWDVDPRSCHAYEGEVIHTATWRKLRYGKLVAEAARTPIPRNFVQPAASAATRA
jgi:isoquinoline 1-oxidoreductase beta subunit